MSASITDKVALELGNLTIQLIQSKANYEALELLYREKDAAFVQLQSQFTDVSTTSQSIIARLRGKIEALSSEVLLLRTEKDLVDDDEPVIVVVKPTDANIDLPESVKNNVNSASPVEHTQSEDK